MAGVFQKNWKPSGELNFDSMQQASMPQEAAAPKQGGLKGFLTSLISEGSGMGGAAGGAALGTMLMPGVGTVLGGLAGGLLGGAGGSAVEQKVRDDKVDWGNVAEEGALSGIFGAGPLRLIKGGVGAAKALKAGTGVAEGASEQIGKSLTGKLAGGMLKQSTIAPTSTLGTASKQNLLTSKSSAESLLRGSGTRKFQNVEKVIGQRVDEVDNLLKGVDTPVPTSSFLGKVTEVYDAIPDKLEKKAFERLYNNAVTKVVGSEVPEQLTLTQVNAIRRQINKQASNVFKKVEKGNPLTPGDNAIIGLRDMLGDTIEQNAPDAVRGAVQTANRDISTFMDAIPEFKRLGESNFSPLGMKIPLVSSAVPRTYQSTMDLAGRAMGGGSGVASPASAAIGAGARVGVADQLFGSNDAQAAQEPPAQESLLGNLTSSGAPAEIGGAEAQAAPLAFPEYAGGAGVGSPEEAVQSPFSEANIQNAIIKDLSTTGGKNVSMLMQLYEMFGKSATEKPMSSAAATTVSNANTGLAALGDLSSEMSSDPGAFGRSNLPGVGMLDKITQGRVSGLLGTTGIKAASEQAMDTIARLRTGAAITSAEESRFMQMLPQAGDPPETQQQKLNYLANQFRFVAERAGGSGGFDPSMLGQDVEY